MRRRGPLPGGQARTGSRAKMRAMLRSRPVIRSLASCAIAAFCVAAKCDEPATPFKLTLGRYLYSEGSDGTDMNLRHTSSLGNAWIGYYREDGGELSQWRTGWDRTFGEAVRVTP